MRLNSRVRYKNLSQLWWQAIELEEPKGFLLCFLRFLDYGGQVAKVAGNMSQYCLPEMREGSIVLNPQDDPYCCPSLDW